MAPPHELPRDREPSYRHSPHLAQWALQSRLVTLLEESVRLLPESSRPASVLEVGAGHGGYTGPLLAAGCKVTAVEMSRPSWQKLQDRYGANERLSAQLDRDASLSDLPGGHALALCISVLHHIPDYLGFLRRVTDHLAPGGTVLTVQDPLWYPRVGRLTQRVDRTAYVVWRIGQGNVRAGFAAMVRRMRGAFPEQVADEVGYYHVVRQGVDEEAVVRLLADRFTDLELFTYWSHHVGATRRPAERAGLTNTFAVRAVGFSPDRH